MGAVRHLLCASDVEGYPMAELLALADDETRALWDDLRLGYTEASGHPLLRAEIAPAAAKMRPELKLRPWPVARTRVGYSSGR